MNKLLLEIQDFFNVVRNMDISKTFKVNLSKSELVILKVIDEIETQSAVKTVAVSDIVDKMEVSAQAISKCLKNLENKDFIERFSNRLDRRRMEVLMTSKGRKALNDILNKIDTTFKTVFEGFDRDEFEEYVRLTRKFKNLYVSAFNPNGGQHQ